jgi:cytochrome c oxidase subunit 4
MTDTTKDLGADRGHEVSHAHIPKVGTLVGVWAALIVLTFCTTAASYWDIGELNIVLAMVIALTKVSLVAWIFMGVRYSTSLTRLFCIAGLVWLVIMMIVTSSDYVSRGWQYEAQPWSTAPSGGLSK